MIKKLLLGKLLLLMLGLFILPVQSQTWPQFPPTDLMIIIDIFWQYV